MQSAVEFFGWLYQRCEQGNINLRFIEQGRIESEFLVRQAKPGESSWLRSQPDKVSRPSEPSFAFMRVTV